MMDADAAQVVDGMVNLGELKTGAGVLGVDVSWCMVDMYDGWVYCTV